MTDKAKVYTKVVEQIKTLLPTMSQDRLVTLSMLVTGMVIEKKAHLSEIGFHIPHNAKPDKKSMCPTAEVAEEVECVAGLGMDGRSWC